MQHEWKIKKQRQADLQAGLLQGLEGRPGFLAVAITSEIWRSSTTRRNTQEIEQIFEAISFHGAVHVQAHKEYIIHSSASFMHCFTISRPNPSEYFTILSLTFISLKKKKKLRSTNQIYQILFKKTQFCSHIFKEILFP